MRAILTSLLFVASACEARAPDRIEIRGDTMGTTWAVTVVGAPAGSSAEALRADVEGLLDGIESRLSNWQAESEVSRFNASQGTAWVPASEELVAVVSVALAVSRLSGGAFDPTILPLVDLWGFGAAGPVDSAPSSRALAAARERVGWQRVAVRVEPPGLRKTDPAIALDLSGVAKGYAVDALSDQLAAHGFADHLVEIGGELRARGAPPNRPWRVAVEAPTSAPPPALIALRDAAIATSGTYRNFRPRADGRDAHVLDPRTGEPTRHALVSVAVVAPSAVRADALATALLVLGPEAAWALAERERLPVLLLTEVETGFAPRSTPEFERLRLGRE